MISRTKPDPQLTEKIIQGCREARPNLIPQELKIAKEAYGWRPFREDGIRIELESFGNYIKALWKPLPFPK